MGAVPRQRQGQTGRVPRLRSPAPPSAPLSGCGPPGLVPLDGGDIAVRREPPDGAQAAAHDRQALALAQELGMRPLQTRCHYGLGILYLRIERPQQARPRLSIAIELYRTMEMTFWLCPAENALAHVEGQRFHRTTGTV
jgi:hypothetical protein